MKSVSCSIGLIALLAISCQKSPLIRKDVPADQNMQTTRPESYLDIDFSAIDPTVNACQNFYEHACGGFIASVEPTPTEPVISLANQKFDRNVERSLDRLFMIEAEPGSELDRLKTFYNSCLADTDSSEALTTYWLERVNSANSADEIHDLIFALASIGVNPFFSYSGAPDPNNLDQYRGQITHSNLWQEPEVVEQAFEAAGMNGEQARADARAVTSIISHLREFRASGDETSGTENPVSLFELMEMAPAIDWPRYFLMVEAPFTRSINLTSDRYMQAVSRELETRSSAELRAYLRWAFLFSLRGELPAPFNEPFGNISPSLRVAIGQPERRCRDATIRGMGVEFSRQYAHNILGMSARRAAYRIGNSIQDEIVDVVEEANWLSPRSRGATADKLRRTDLKLGFPDRWPEIGDFALSRGDFLANVLAARRFEEQRSWHRANKPRSRENWDMLVYPWVGAGMAVARLVSPNAFPDNHTNSMVMTAAFLNDPYFSEGAALETNYATFGVVFAHEFVHLAESYEFGALGQPQRLWSESDLASARRQRQCVIDQAEASPAPAGSQISGEFNYSENVADLGAVRIAFDALSRRLGSRRDQPDETGMTPAKRFFYKYAQNFCVAASPATLSQYVTGDPHALPSYRVNGPLSNLPAFSEAFGCDAQTPMRRSSDNICRVW